MMTMSETIPSIALKQFLKKELSNSNRILDWGVR